jgi:putative transposase
LCQVVNGEEQPIAVVSKSVSGSEVNWSTVEKECYAIYHSIRELERLLQGRHFTLHTDHQNLLKLMEGGSKKVHAWKLALAMLDFKIEYVKGEDNQVADSMSRLCSIRTRVMPDPVLRIGGGLPH